MYKYSLPELRNLAESFADEIIAPATIFLYGNLGAGKTTFSKFFLESLLIDKAQKVTSPTFNIVQIYETKKGSVWHIDLYRLKDERELFDLGILEAMNESICIIEWPEILEKYAKNYNISSVRL